MLLIITDEPGHSIPTRLHMRPTMSHISAVRSQSSKGLWEVKDQKRHQADSEDSGLPAQMRRLIRVFAGRTSTLVGNAVARLNCKAASIAFKLITTNNNRTITDKNFWRFFA